MDEDHIPFPGDGWLHIGGTNGAASNGLEKQMSFTEFLRPGGGLIVFTTIPEKGRLHTLTFDFPGEREDALDWLKDENADRRNVYYQHQLVSRKHSRRLKAEDVAAVQFIHLDIDWNDASGKRMTAIPEQIAAKVEELRAWRLPPSALIGSGNGLQVLWRLRVPFGVDLAKRANKGVLAELGGDPSGSDGVKLLRVPGFVNWPLKHPSLQPTRSSLIELNEAAYNISEFPWSEDEATGKAVEVSADVEEVTEDALEALPIPATLREIITTGASSDPDHRPRDESRSGYLMYAVKWLAGCGVPDGQIIGILLNPWFEISDSVLNCQGHSPEGYARRQVMRAKAHIKAENREAFPLLSTEDVFGDD